MVGATRLFGAQAPHPKGPPTALPSLKLRLEHAVSHVLLILPNKKTTLASGFYGRNGGI